MRVEKCFVGSDRNTRRCGATPQLKQLGFQIHRLRVERRNGERHQHCELHTFAAFMMVSPPTITPISKNGLW